MRTGMDHSRRVPEDLMGRILGAGAGVGEEDHASPESGVATPSWEGNAERVGVAFNLSRRVNTELDRIRLEMEEETHPSKSEIAEVALRIAVEDFRSRGRESELARRIEERHATRATYTSEGDGPRVVRSVDDTGLIVETTYDSSGAILDEDVVGSVAELPVVDEYVDERGRLVSRAQDELGNTFEQVLDNDLNPLETRLLEGW
jgi:hypothetical protein